MVFYALIVCFGTVASSLACLPFLKSGSKAKQALRHMAVCAIFMLLCSTACMRYPALCGFAVGICFSFYYLMGFRHLQRGISLALVFVQLVCNIFALLLCRLIDASMLLLPILFAPLLCITVKPLQNALDASIQIAKSKRHLKKLKNLICVAVAGDETAAYMLHHVLKQKTFLVEETSICALADAAKTLDSTTRVLIYPLSENEKEAARMLRFAPCHMLLCAGADGIFLSVIRKRVKNSAAFVSSSEMEVSAGRLIRSYTVDGAESYDISISKVKTEQDGTHFVLKERASQQRLECRMFFLGQRNVRAAAAVITAARLLDNSLEQIVQTLSLLDPRAHHLFPQFIENGAVLIDDTANSDVQYALQTIGELSSRKIAVLGSYPDALEQNKQLGRDAAAIVQLAILAGDGAEAVRCGLLEAGFPMENIFHVQSAAHLRRTIRNIAQAGDVFLQVLTDFNYWEA